MFLKQSSCLIPGLGYHTVIKVTTPLPTPTRLARLPVHLGLTDECSCASKNDTGVASPHHPVTVRHSRPISSRFTLFRCSVNMNLRSLKAELSHTLAIPLSWYKSEENLKTSLKTYACQCSQQHYLQLVRYGSNLSVYQQMNG